MRLYPRFPVLSPLTLDFFHFASSEDNANNYENLTLRKEGANITSGFSLRSWDLDNWYETLLHVQSCHFIQETELAVRRFHCEHCCCLFLNSYNFIVTIIFLIWNKIIQVWGVTKLCNDDGCLVKVLRRQAGGPMDKWGIAVVTSQIQAFRNHIAKK